MSIFDPFSVWFGGFLLMMVFNCTIVKDLMGHLKHPGITLTIAAVFWPVLAILTLCNLVKGE